MKFINTHQAKTDLSRILAEIEKTQQPVRICRNGKPIADLIPVGKRKNPLTQHDALKRGVKILYDPVAPLSRDEWSWSSQ